MRPSFRTIAAASLLVVAAGCGSADRSQAPAETVAGTTGLPAGATALPEGSEPVTLDPAEFTTRIDNPYWPMAPGSRWVYRETDAEGKEQRVEVTVTDQTRTILGIEARVVHDVVSENGQPVEDTYDWYAQDADGNIWYLGEDTKEYENGKVTTTAGSWEAGVDGAQPGILLPAEPEPGMAYRQEYYAGEAEDAAEVVRVDATADVPFGSFEGVLETEDTTALDPSLVEHKFYARGIGPVLAVTVSGGSGREELVSFERS